MPVPQTSFQTTHRQRTRFASGELVQDDHVFDPEHGDAFLIHENEQVPTSP